MKYVAGVALLGTVVVGAYLLLKKDSGGSDRKGLFPGLGLPSLEDLKDKLPRLPKLLPRIPVPAPIAPVPAVFWWFWRKRKK